MVWSSLRLPHFGLSTPRGQASDFSIYFALDGIGQIQISTFANVKSQCFFKSVRSQIILSENKRHKITNDPSKGCLNP